MTRLDDIRRRCEAAASGPWEVKTNAHRETSGEAWGWIDGPFDNWCWSNKHHRSKANAEFVAAAREDIPYLLSLVDELSAEVEQGQERDKRLMLEVCKLACESVEREKKLAKLEAEVERMAEEMQNAEIHADCMEARAIAFEAEVKRWVDKHKQAALNFQQENAECRRLSAENERLREVKNALENDLINANMNLEHMAQLVEADQWIPVSERLPEQYQWVLIYAPLWAYPVLAFLRDDDEFWTGVQAVTPTHWMPLPSAPQTLAKDHFVDINKIVPEGEKE